MALPSSGQITLNEVNVELGNSGTAYIEMNSSAVRGLFGIASGEIEMADGHGKSNASWFGSRGLEAGGNASGTYENNIDYITIASTGNAADFGDLTVARDRGGFVTSGSRGVLCAGLSSDALGSVQSNVMDYITIASTGNATDFGDKGTGDYGVSGLSDGSRGVFSRGFNYASMDYITIASTGNTTNFGTHTIARRGMAAVSDGSRGVWVGGQNTNNSYAFNVMDYITIASTGNAIDFGDCTSRGNKSGVVGGSRAVFGGGSYYSSYKNRQTSGIDYITITSLGNSTTFGSLPSSNYGGNGCSNDSRGVFATRGGSNNMFRYVTIASTGNSTDFGTSVTAGYGGSMTSGA